MSSYGEDEYEYPDKIEEQSKRFYCNKHDIWYIQNASGQFDCVACMIEGAQNLELGGENSHE